MSTEWIKLIWKVYLAKVKFPARRNLTSITHGQSFILFPLSPQAIFSPLIASADSCSFLFLSSIYHLSSPFFQITVFTCNFMWFIKLRASAGMCGICMGVCWCVWVCAGVLGCAQVCSGVRGCAWSCTGARKGTYMYVGVIGWVGVVCTGVHGCVW